MSSASELLAAKSLQKLAVDSAEETDNQDVSNMFLLAISQGIIALAEAIREGNKK